MAKVYTEEELNDFSRETLMAVILSMQDQIHQLNTNMERLIEQIADETISVTAVLPKNWKRSPDSWNWSLYLMRLKHLRKHCMWLSLLRKM